MLDMISKNHQTQSPGFEPLQQPRPGLLAHSPTPSSLSAFASLGVAWGDSTGTQNPGKDHRPMGIISAVKNIEKYRFQKRLKLTLYIKPTKKKAPLQKERIFFQKQTSSWAIC